MENSKREPLVALSSYEKEIHEEAINLCRSHRKTEAQLISVLQKIGNNQLYMKFGARSLYDYALRELDMSESMAYSFISVSRKASEIPELNQAISERRLSVSKASRVVSALTPKNAKNLISFAERHSARDVDAEVAKHNPRQVTRNRVRAIDGEQFELRITVTKDILEQLERVDALLAQKGLSKRKDMALALKVSLEAYLQKNDPVLKAERVLMRKASGEPEVTDAEADQLCTYRVEGANLSDEQNDFVRAPLNAEQRHRVNERDRGRCTFEDSNGERCNSDRWVEIHHIVPVSLGGSNDVENLRTLCSAHHDFLHKQAAGPVSVLRCGGAEYRIDPRPSP